MSLDGERVPAVKIGNMWVVDEDAFAAASSRAIESRCAHRRGLETADGDYAARKLHPSGRTETTWGGYRVRGDFQFVWSSIEIMMMRSDGHWRCNHCWKAAGAEHDEPECHRCSDWGACGTDCTLSRAFCAGRGTSLTL